MVKRVLVTAGKILAAIGVLLVVGMVLLTLPDCIRSRVLVVNGSTSEIEDMTLSIQNIGSHIIVWSGRLGISEGRRIGVTEGREGISVLEGRYAKTGIRFEKSPGYETWFVLGPDDYIQLFLIKDEGVYVGLWSDPLWSSEWSSDVEEERIPTPGKEMEILTIASGVGAMFAHFMSCADYELWSLIRGSPRY